MRRLTVFAVSALALAGCRPASELAPVDPVTLAQTGGAAVCADFSLHQDVYNHANDAVRAELARYDESGRGLAAATELSMASDEATFTGLDDVTMLTSCELPMVLSTAGFEPREYRIAYTVQPNAAGTDILLRVQDLDEIKSRLYSTYIWWELRQARPTEAGPMASRETEPGEGRAVRVAEPGNVAEKTYTMEPAR